MWVIFFDEAPHFWLIGGESYRVGKKDCHVIIQGDRSISRTHLTITVGLQSPTGASGPGEWAPQPISLLDSSTYGTAIVACGEEVDTLDDAHHGADGRGGGAEGAATPAPEVCFPGVFCAPAVAAAAGAERKRPLSGSISGCRVPQPALPLTRGVPCHIPVHRSSWRQFTIQLGHHGAALKLMWLDLSVLCEDVDVEAQAKLSHALRCCGVRQESVPSSIQSVSAAEVQGCTEGRLRSEDGAAGLPSSSVTVLGGSGLSLSQRSTGPGTPAVAPPLTAVAAATVDAGGTGLSSGASRCYNTVSFLVTSTVQPSTAVVAMLCRAVPIVTPAFFVAVCERSSPQRPLPDPSGYVPPLSPWWRDFLAHVVPPVDESRPPVSDAGAGGLSATASSLAPPSIAVTAGAAEATATGAPATSHLRYFAPHPQRQQLFCGITFVLLQRSLYEEAVNYLDGTGARLLWEDRPIRSLSAPICGLSSSSQEALEMLQSFYRRHQRHVLLFNEAEPLLPWPGCVDVVRHGLGLCSVEYGALIEAIVTIRPLSLPVYPDDSQIPHTLEEVEARVAAAAALAASSTLPAASAVAATEHGPEGDKEEGRRTDAQLLFPELEGGGGGGALCRVHLPGSDAGLDQGDVRDARVHRRPRKEGMDGWVSFDGPATVGPAATGSSTNGKAGTSATVRTAELQVGPHPLPPYPCFEDANAASVGAGATGAAATGLARGSKLFVKQALLPAEPLVELEEHRARRQLAASMLTARVPTVDAEDVVPEQVVMGSSRLASRVAEATSGAFNVFDTAAHNASIRRQGAAKRRGGHGGSASSAASRAPAHRPPHGGTARRRPADNNATVKGDEGIAADSVEVTARRSGLGGALSASAMHSATFHIFDIDGIF
ncbi:hypothetical protein LSCM1_07940 [Leishmania martiniquensis]|uniref:FHA domain-containing protein n=1 Tax=Leishmania martiniquensis TaxID=1580590 RepID=A0A836GRA0_9TRYP|nr:hypothetical protein LSCM1_07940 [Leishmania martiniquensis]